MSEANMKKSILRAYAPASIGNVSLGFDLLGAALKPIDGSLLGDEVDIEIAEQFSLVVTGRFADKLPPDPDSNIVTRCYQHFIAVLEQQGHAKSAIPLLKMTLHKHLPIGSGLGSSASSIVAALHGLNQFFAEYFGKIPFTENELLLIMGELEGQISGSVHYDNVAPCFLGGLTLMAEHKEQVALQLPMFENWYWVSCYSGMNVSTAAARNILPKQVSMSNTIQFGRQLAVFIDALYRKDEKLAAAMMLDVIAEPYRKSLLPRFDESRAFAEQHGAIAFGISGSGPTVFAVCDNIENAKIINQWLTYNYIQNDTGFSHICQLDTSGASISHS
ncbi:homoserine kinase [Paraglaciecola psychrophila]|uniref:Homoserine kinase n=1 Tax=Paraglaciecola psychrophila 170 TaxID=1129794 RepID=K7A7C7_9ALTE|nr:homoserine kinase [Paraglaciecola psychrophila]AGH42819.1 homoserine kinase [Paraglaciecola psychrophila 170]GAC36708.1 homoserine kinase [Paraglaciecola psychrophila 170]